MKPPTDASFPSLDEEVQNQRSLDKWGNMMGKNKRQCCGLLSKISAVLARGGDGSQI